MIPTDPPGLHRGSPGLSQSQRIDLWDGIVASLRDYFRREGLREVSTPVRVPANAVEPFIEALPCGPFFLQSSPELAMKRLLGTRSIYQIAHCFRAGERGPAHREEFHLVEWYRLGADLRSLQLDIERMVERATQSAAALLGCGDLEPPQGWIRIPWLELFEALVGKALRGDESAAELEPHLLRMRSRLALRSEDPASAPEDSQVAQLGAWVELFSLWSDAYLDPWLAEHSVQQGVHLIEFPAPLAALAQKRERHAMRFESYWRGAELANAYDELRDAAEQRRRFERVNGLRRHYGSPDLPLCEAFLGHLAANALPPCAGAAMGLERLISTVCRQAHLSQIEVCVGFNLAPK